MPRKPEAEFDISLPPDLSDEAQAVADLLESSKTRLNTSRLGFWGTPAEWDRQHYIICDPMWIWDRDNKHGRLHISQRHGKLLEEDWTVCNAVLFCGRRLQDEVPGDPGDTSKGNWLGLIPLLPRGKKALHTLPVRSVCANCERAFLIFCAQANALATMRQQMQAQGQERTAIPAVYWGSDVLFGFQGLGEPQQDYKPLGQGDQDYSVAADENLPEEEQQ